MEPELPSVFGDFVGMEGRRIAHFANGYELRATHLDPHAAPAPLSADGKTWWCGSLVFARLIETAQLRAEARKRAALERMIAEERGALEPVIPPGGHSATQSPKSEIGVGAEPALTTTDAAALGLASRATIYRLLKVHPAEIMHGDAHPSARWADRASFDAWLAAALRTRRMEGSAIPVVPAAARRPRPPKQAAATTESPLVAARRKLSGSGR